MRLNPVIGLSGKLGSGKSSLASILADRSGWRRAAFGDYLRHLASQRRTGMDRASLQQLGDEQIALGWDQFCSNVLAYFNWKPGQGLVVEGIRHIAAVDTLSSLIAPQRFFLVYLALEETLRRNRLIQRDGVDALFPSLEGHSSEAQVTEALPRAAALILDASQSLEELAEEVWESLETMGSPISEPAKAAGVAAARRVPGIYRPELN